MAEIATAIAPALVALAAALATLAGAAALIIGLANVADGEERARRHMRAGGHRYGPPEARRTCPNGLARLAAQARANRKRRSPPAE